jgi:hypothetical protein
MIYIRYLFHLSTIPHQLTTSTSKQLQTSATIGKNPMQHSSAIYQGNWQPQHNRDF